jgi:hypothetical protein
MYSTCLFCNGALGANEVIEHFPVGKRLAFDSLKGRLWVVCTHCQRWNLTPIEERLEAIEECERLFRGTMIRVSTDNIGLATLRSGLELVRIGEALRPEFAAWRYAGNFSKRRVRSYAITGATVAGAGIAAAAVGAVVAPLMVGSMSLVAVPGFATIMAAIPVLGVAAAQEYITNDRVIARFSRKHRLLTVRTQHVGAAELDIGGGSEASLSVPHDSGWVTFTGTEAIHATTVILANTNRSGGDKSVVANAVRQIEETGTAEGYLESASRRGGWRRGRIFSVLNDYRALGAMRLSTTERFALEMAVHEETERRAMHGELAVLEEAWRGAEEIAEICDGVLTPPHLDEWLRRPS